MSFDVNYSLLPRPVITVMVDWVKKTPCYLLTYSLLHDHQELVEESMIHSPPPLYYGPLLHPNKVCCFSFLCDMIHQSPHLFPQHITCLNLHFGLHRSKALVHCLKKKRKKKKKNTANMPCG